MAAAQKIFMFVFSSRSSMELNIPLGPVETRKLLFRSYIITYRLFALAKTDAENCNSYLHMQIDSGRFTFRFCGQWGRRQESYLLVPRVYKECGQNWDINVSFIIHVNFDYVWVEHYPVTLMDNPS